jgi:hypothetical protein
MDATDCIRSLLFDDVIDNTIGVMSCLRTELEETAVPNKELVDLLLQLTSESIREALHKGELHITNAIIRRKNFLLTVAGVEVPEGHAEIDPKDYPNYHW